MIQKALSRSTNNSGECSTSHCEELKTTLQKESTDADAEDSAVQELEYETPKQKSQRLTSKGKQKLKKVKQSVRATTAERPPKNVVTASPNIEEQKVTKQRKTKSNSSRPTKHSGPYYLDSSGNIN